MKSFFSKMVGCKNRLTRLSEEEPVTKLALAIILVLDVFVLSIIFGGLNDHTQQLTSPDEYMPYQCRQVFIDKSWTQANKTARLQDLVLSDYNNYSYRHDSPFEASRLAKMHPLCQSFYEQVKRIAEDPSLRDVFVERQQAGREKDQMVKQFDRENEVYDTALLENIAAQPSTQLASLKESIQSRSREIERLNARIKELDGAINRHELVQDFWALTHPGEATQRQKLIDDLNRFERWYLFRELLWQMLFLLPLLALFWVWHIKSARKSRGIQSLISAHLMVVASIPIVIKIINLVMELVPFHFFKDLFAWLERMHIIALWHYVVIIGAIAVALLCVFIIQKKIFNRKRMYEKRLMKGCCFACGKTLPKTGAIAACPFCGVKQQKTCSVCGADTPAQAAFCTHCGREQESHQT